MEFKHISILLPECLDGLKIKPDGVYIDATLGGAGHSSAIVERLNKNGRLIGIDQDDMALSHARERLEPYLDRVSLLKSNFRLMKDAVTAAGYSHADGILFDLGVSSPQLDIPERGFSYMLDARLDMRMDRQQPQSAYEAVNGWEQETLKKILYEYGEERYAPQIAAAIVKKRAQKPIETTSELVDIIKSALPPQAKREKQHPAKRSFQALRIAVNDELGALREALRQAIDLLAPGGRLAVITFHSLEDRIVKNVFLESAKGCTCPKDFPVCVCGKTPVVRLVTRKPVIPGAQEIEKNPRARSAKLRVCEKL